MPLLWVEKALSRTMDKLSEVQLVKKPQERTNKLTGLAMLLLILGVLSAIPFFMSREKLGEESPHYRTVPLATPFESVRFKVID
jgi:hypothetical protein